MICQLLAVLRHLSRELFQSLALFAFRLQYLCGKSENDTKLSYAAVEKLEIGSNVASGIPLGRSSTPPHVGSSVDSLFLLASYETLRLPAGLVAVVS